jgi:hypothetical protein
MLMQTQVTAMDDDQQKKKAVDLNSLLICANIAVAALIVLGGSWTDGNPYIDRTTIVLGLLLCVQTHLALMLERSRRDPLILLITIDMIFYYGLRIFTLALYPFSLVFDRYPYAPADTDYALVFILIANLFLYGGLYLAGSPSNPQVATGNWRAFAPSRVVFLIVLAIGVTYFGESHEPGVAPARIVGFLELFVSSNVIILMALAYYFLFRQSLSRGFAVILGSLILLDMAIHTLTGSRSAIVTIIQDCVFVGLAMSGRLQLRRVWVVLGLIALPSVVVLLIGAFIVSTYNRSSRQLGASFNLTQAIHTAGEAGTDIPIQEGLETTLPLVFARAGFLDYSIEAIAHRAEYLSVINLPAYGESIVDNILTPGFDVYDMPKIANALEFVYMDWGRPSKIDVPESYQSDPLGIYGEFYVLWRYASLPLIFVTAFLFKRLYIRARSGNPFFLVVKRVIILYLFLEIIRSFGIDWVLAETVPIVAAIYLYKYFFASKPMNAASALGPVPAG